jgi:hypothetical protein
LGARRHTARSVTARILFCMMDVRLEKHSDSSLCGLVDCT